MVKLREMREESSRISLRSNPTHETPVALGSTPVAVALEPFAVLAKPVAVALTPLAKLESPGRGGFGAEGVGAGASHGIAVGDAAVAGPPTSCGLLVSGAGARVPMWPGNRTQSTAIVIRCARASPLRPHEIATRSA